MISMICNAARGAALSAAVALLGGAPFGALAAAQDDSSLIDAAREGPVVFSGAIDLAGNEIAFTAEFEAYPDGDGFVAIISIPMQGVEGLALEDVAWEGERIRFKIGAPANAVFEGRFVDDSTVEGTLSQAGAEFPFSMKRLGADETPPGPNRPQMPQGPFPYEAREVGFRNEDAGVQFAGTLTIPDGRGPHPAVVMITGSGPQDRDETLFGHKPFLVIADALSRQGVAVLRFDDRGVGGSGGSVTEATTEDFASDALAAVRFLKGISDIDPAHIGLIGHSEGGYVAPVAAARSEDVAFVVLLAGPGVSGREILESQSALLQEAMGVPEQRRLAELDVQRRVFDVLLDDQLPMERRRERIRELMNEAMKPLISDDAERAAAIDQQEAAIFTPWFMGFLEFDPRPFLRRLRVPVLALNGELDLQVPADQNLSELERNLREAPTRDVTILRMAGMNHLFQPAETGLPGEYGQIETTVAPAALEVLTNWIRRRTGLAGPPPGAGQVSSAGAAAPQSL